MDDKAKIKKSLTLLFFALSSTASRWQRITKEQKERGFFICITKS
ncbi:hypothetical protein BMG_3639 [Priestia megaterium]|nr:hypothetical protein BMG_3639 [Priestia megaterium]